MSREGGRGASGHGISTLAVHGGEDVALPPRRPVAVPVYQTAPWAFASSGELSAAFDALPGDRSAMYSRYENPTVRSLEGKVAALEGAGDALAFASGMAAIATTLASLLRSGDRLLAAADLYGGTDSWLATLGESQPEIAVERCPLGGLAGRLEEMAEEAAGASAGTSAAAAGPVAAVYLETPSNPLLTCTDLAAVVAAARRLGGCQGRRVAVVVDGTMASPAVQRPLALGVDLVLHSATKFLAGHSDVTAGVVAGGRPGGAAGDETAASDEAAAGAELMRALRDRAVLAGASLDPHAASLVARGLKTLALRLDRQCANAARLAALAAGHPAVSAVHYPGLVASGGFDPVASGQMVNGGPMLAFELAGGLAAARAAVDALELVRIIPSLGGVETGVVLPAITSHRSLSAEERAERGIADGLVRVSCGIEDGDDLAADLERALAAAG